ncbi:unnamed protein product [Cyprideis torosa]|uniref:Programmed cell death protein 10 dimerisation domain-containing protein n=1 Tax=Cyprideis torosa TaxID=163714 RepID=A0A7R8ZT24_9CRUS|nr:unnamed protein product [Cyprideis torosa]CAG0897195.1 unnamed protein product [Cyprideis torosa]
MRMGDDTPVVSLMLPILVKPTLTKLEKDHDLAGTQVLRGAFSKAEAAHPGFTYDFVMGLARRGDLACNIHESLLKLQGRISENEEVEFWLSRTEEPFQDLNRKASALKRILGRIPEEITDRKSFLETIREIASAIKKLLDTLSTVSAFLPSSSARAALDLRKKDFVKTSKRFSNTLKEYFKEGQSNNAVFVASMSLIYQTNLLILTIKRHGN